MEHIEFEGDWGLDRHGKNSYPKSVNAVVSEKGQVTIPKPLRDRLGLKAGQVLRFREENGDLIASKETNVDPVGSVYGILRLGASTDQVMKRLRGEADTL